MAKMKLDFKAVLLNHGEKIGAGVVALLGLAGLGTAHWSSCDLDPTVLQTNADSTKSTWLSSVWPEDKQATYTDTPPVEDLAKQMSGSIEQAGKYATSRRWNEPLKQSQEKLQSVAVISPVSPEASLVIFPLVEREGKAEVTAPEEETPQKKSKKGKKQEDTKDLENLFGVNNAGAAAGGGLPGGGLPGGGLPGGLGGPGDLSGAGGAGLPGGLGNPGGLGGPGGLSSGGSEGSMPPGGMIGSGGKGGGAAGPGGYGSAPPGDGMGGMGMLGGLGGPGSGMGMDGGLNLGILEKKKVRSHAGVSVRYVFNLYAQARQMAEALNLPGNEAQNRVQLVGFEVQRQRQIPGSDPWVGEWESVSLDALSEILDASEGFDMDIVLPAVIAYEVSMPLPRRAAGRWTPENASHKLLEEFELSDDEQQIINLMNENLRNEAEKRKAEIPPAMATSGGFSRYSLGQQALMGGLNNSGFNGENAFENMFNDAYSQVKGDKGEEGEQGSKKSKEEDEEKKAIEKKARNLMAAGRLMLVRFMDFTCDRGTAYRYRVRLEMANPLFNLPIDSLAEPEMAAQRTLFSDWSEPTPPTFVPSGYRYYPDKAESRARAEEYAGMSMYYEHETAGTPLMASVRVPAGSRIGGKQTVEVVDLGNNTLEMTEVDLKSLDYLVAVTEAPRLARGEFPELKAAFEAAGTLRPVGDRLTVIDANGAIITRYVGDGVTNGDKEVSRGDDERLTKYVLDTYKNLRPESADATNNPFGGEGSGSDLGGLNGMGGLGGLGGLGDGMDFGGGMRQGSSGSRRGQRGQRGSGSGGMSGGMPGMPGGGMPGGGMPGMPGGGMPGGGRRGRGSN
jgi:hypothetical protein